MRCVATLTILMSIMTTVTAALPETTDETDASTQHDNALRLRIPRIWSEAQERNVGDSETTKTQILRSRTGITQHMLKHYGATDCQTDEIVYAQDDKNAVCAPKCTDFMPCPTDVPAGVTATPMCVLENTMTGDKYCALICDASGTMHLRGRAGPCGDGGVCQPMQGLGICTYPVKA